MVIILAIERLKDGINGMKDRPSDFAILLCWALCKDDKVINNDVQV